MKFNLNSFRILFLLVIVSGFVSCEKKSPVTKSPNIILFLVDDMGWQDTSVPFWHKKTPFNDIYETPGMERLAAAGMKFTNAYASSVCSPTRVSLMTGMNAARHRVTNWTLRKDQLQPMETRHKTLEFPEWNINGLDPTGKTKGAVHATPLPQLLADAGYFTIHAGKAHLGAIGTPGSDPVNLGFKVNIAGHAAGAPKSYLGTENFGNNGDPNNVWAVPGLDQYHGKDIFLTEALTQEAIKAMDRARGNDQPFFLYMAHYAVHTPLYADRRFFEKYLQKGLDTIEAKYASLVEGMDKSLGDLLDYVEANELEEETIILFMSDNGGLSAVARKPPMHRHNAPLKSGKGSAYEGGIRVPMLVKWPGITQANSSTETPVIIEDFYPTILKMAGIEKPSTIQTVDGVDLSGVLSDQDMKERSLYWHYPNFWGASGPGIGSASYVRSGSMKLIYYHEDRRLELFDLDKDLEESNDLSKSEPEKLKKLAQDLTDHLKKTNAQMPKDKVSGETIPYPIEVIESMK